MATKMPPPLVPPSPQAQKWDDAYLDKMRMAGDAAAKEATQFLFSNQNDVSIYKYLGEVATNESFKQIDGFPKELADFFAQAQVIPESFNFYTKDESGLTGEEKILIANKVFEKYGFYIVALLFFKSLPSGYMAPYPSKVLTQTRLLKDNATRRLLETAQMIFDVLAKDWYKPHGAGVASVLKVRLMHAGMRAALTNDDQTMTWDKDSEDPIKGIKLGMPINQEDKVLTLNVFSIIIIEGLEQLGVTLTPLERECYFYNWRLVGHFIGIDEELNPTTIDDCWYLQKTIERRLYHENNPDGADLTKALLGVITKRIRGEIAQKLVEDCTLYFTKFPHGNPIVAKSLGLHTPSKFELFLDKVADTVMTKLDNTKKGAMTLGEKLEQKNSYLAAIAKIVVAPLRIKNMAVDTIKMNLFTELCKTLMYELQQQAKLSTNKPAFSNHSELLSMWQLESFDMDIPFMKTTKAQIIKQKIMRISSLVVAPAISAIALINFYRVQFQHTDPFYIIKPEQLGMQLKANQPPEHFIGESLGVGITFLGVTILVYMAAIKKKPKYFNYAYMLILAAVLFWFVVYISGI